MPGKILKVKRQDIPPAWLTPDDTKTKPDFLFKITIESIQKEVKNSSAFQELLDFKPIKGNLKPAVNIIREIREKRLTK